MRPFKLIEILQKEQHEESSSKK